MGPENSNAFHAISRIASERGNTIILSYRIVKYLTVLSPFSGKYENRRSKIDRRKNFLKEFFQFK